MPPMPPSALLTGIPPTVPQLLVRNSEYSTSWCIRYMSFQPRSRAWQRLLTTSQGGQSTQETRVQNALGDVAGCTCLSIVPTPLGARGGWVDGEVAAAELPPQAVVGAQAQRAAVHAAEARHVDAARGVGSTAGHRGTPHVNSGYEWEMNRVRGSAGGGLGGATAETREAMERKEEEEEKARKRKAFSKLVGADGKPSRTIGDDKMLRRQGGNDPSAGGPGAGRNTLAGPTRCTRTLLMTSSGSRSRGQKTSGATLRQCVNAGCTTISRHLVVGG